MASSGLLPSLRSASRAKSTIMMPFFFTIPMRRMMPITAMTVSSLRQARRANIAPHRLMQGGKDGNRVDITFVEYPEHNIDGHECGEDQKRFVGKGRPEGLGSALKLPWMLAGMFICFSVVSNASTASPRAAPGARLNDIVSAGNCPWRVTTSGPFFSVV